jgi:arginine repressor
MNSFDLLKFRNQLLAESVSVEENTINEDLSYLAAWKVLKGPGGYIFQIQGPNRDTIGARVNKAGMVTLDGEGAGAAQAVQQIADQFGTETEVLYGDDSLTTVISEPDFNAIFPDTISEAKMTKADEVGSDGVAEEDALEEGTLEEMASFYKLSDDSPEALAAIAAAKEKYAIRSTDPNS